MTAATPIAPAAPTAPTGNPHPPTGNPHPGEAADATDRRFPPVPAGRRHLRR